MCIYRFLLHFLLSKIFVGYILCKIFHCSTLSLVSFLVFQAVCHTSSFKIKPNFFCQKLHAVGTIFCLLVINIFFTCFGFTLYSIASHGGLIYASLFSPLNHSNHCFGIALTKALYSKIAFALFYPSSALISSKGKKTFLSGWITSYIVSIPLFRHFGKKRTVPLYLIRSLLNRS